MERKSASKSRSKPASNGHNKSTQQRRGGAARNGPRVTVSGDGRHTRTIIKHREFVTDLNGSTAFSNAILAINPGKINVFPWLGLVALSYERYRFHKLWFHFKPLWGDAVASTNATLGAVVMCMNYDVLDSGFNSKMAMESYEGSVSGKPSESLVFKADISPSRSTVREYYTRANNGVVSGSDARLYDIGSMQIATVGQQAVSVIGELWVEYEVELLQPRIPSPPGVEVLAVHAPFTPTTGAWNFGSGPTDVNSTMFLVAGTNSIRPVTPGRYLVEIRVNMVAGQTCTWGAGSVTTTLPNLVVGPTFGVQLAGDGTRFFALSFVVDWSDPASMFTLTTPTLSGAVGAADLYIVRVPQLTN